MSEMHLKEPGFTHNACGLLTKNKEIIRFKETRDSRHIYQNELSKACLQHDMGSAYFKNLNRRITADKVLHDKAFNIFKFTKYYGINVDLVQWFINFLIEKLLVEQFKMKLYLEKN